MFSSKWSVEFVQFQIKSQQAFCRNQQADFKFYMEETGTRIAKIILKKNKSGGLTLFQDLL